MFWKKKKQEVNSSEKLDYAGFLFVFALECADDYYEVLKNEIPEQPLVKDKSDHWYFYFAVAAVMTGILELDEDYGANYAAILERLNKWDEQGVEAAENFNGYIKNSSLIKNDVDNISIVIAQWLYMNVKETSTIEREDAEPFIRAGSVIVNNFLYWYSKNQLN